MTNAYKALTIAGSDPIGGAGIQADLKTFQELKIYGMTAVTAVTSQNTLGVKGFADIPLDLIESQIDAVFEDIRPDAVKTGMLAQIPVIELVARKLREYKVENYVMDPVMVAKSGDPLIAEDAKEALIKELLPLAKIVTPNVSEAEVMVGKEIKTSEDMKDAAKALVEGWGAKIVVIKRGQFADSVRDVLYDGVGFKEFVAPRIDTRNTHGTGCTYSAAITAYLAQGKEITEALALAKEFITCAIRDNLDLGKGNGPTNHWAHR